MRNKKTRTMVECALMIAMATVLSIIPLFHMPQGGTVTLCSMAPLVIISLRHGAKWGLLSGAVFGLVQTLMGFQNVLYCTTYLAMVGCVLLDYIIAYTVMGFAGPIASRFGNRSVGIAVGTAVTGLARYACSFLSGILIWGAYAPEGTPVWIYSLLYNGSYMLPEIVITVVAAVVIMRILEKRMTAKA